MSLRLFVLGTLALMMTAVALPAPPLAARGEAGSEYALIERTALELGHGDLSAKGQLIVWHPDGTSTVRVIDGHDFLAISKQVTDLVDEGTNVEAANPTSGGVGAGTAYNPPAPFPAFPPTQIWPFCDAATAYVYFVGAPPSGASFAKREGTGAVSPLGPVCPLLGAPFGDAYVWSDVTIDSRLLPAGVSVTRQVGVAEVMLPKADDARGVAGGYLLGHPVASAHGSGSAVSMVWCPVAGTCFNADMFRGNGAVVLVGNEQL